MPEHVFTPEYLAYLAERDEPVTATEADLAIPWHTEPTPNDPRGRWAVLRLGESFEKSTRTKPTAVFDRKEDALLACAILPGLGKRLRFRLASEPDDRGYPPKTRCGRSLATDRASRARQRGPEHMGNRAVSHAFGRQESWGIKNRQAPPWEHPLGREAPSFTAQGTPKATEPSQCRLPSGPFSPTRRLKIQAA